MKTKKRFSVVAAILGLALILPLGSAALAAGEKTVVYGADLTPPQREELRQIFGVDDSMKTETVTVEELRAALQGTGITVTADDKAISSAGLTCLEKGQGLTVRTQNITRATASLYANALVTAGVGDANVLVAAPAANPVSGETALAGVLKGFPQCQAGKQPEPERVRLAYEQFAQSVAVAGEGGDLGKASSFMLKAAQPVVTDQAQDDAAIGTAIDSAAASENVTIAAAKRGELIAFMKKLSGVDYGEYAQGYDVQQLAPNEVKVVPIGAGAPAGSGAQAAAGAAAAAQKPATGAPAPAAGAQTPAAMGTTFTGDVQQAGSALTVRSDGRDRQVAPGQNLVVTRDGQPAAISDIRQGDQVRVTTNPDGSAQRIDATSTAGGTNWAAWLPLLLLLPLLGGLLWFLAKRRRRDSFIVERNVVERNVPVTDRRRRDETVGTAPRRGNDRDDVRRG